VSRRQSKRIEVPKVMIADEEVISAVDAQAGTAREVLRFVHGHPELGHEEHASSAHIAARLAGGGFQVERGVGGMATAFRATLVGARPGRSVGIVALYDAVPAVVGRKIEIGSVMQLCDKRDAVLPALASPP
jgi:metal-dependent amidase/aminoacylase/carboxypeptidase family protein